MNESISRKILNKIDKLSKKMTSVLIKWGWNARLIFKQKKTRKISKSETQEIKTFWSNYSRRVSVKWSAYYSYASEIFDFRYIPDSLYYSEILPKLNSSDYSKGLNDKNYLSLLFDTKQPTTLIRNIDNILLDANYEIVDKNSIVSILMNKNIVFKPSRDTYGGEGVFFFKINQENIATFLEKIRGKENYIIQEELKQSLILSEIHPESLNTIRLVTLLWNKDVHVLSSILRMGNDGNKVDNYSAGGLICPIKNDGRLSDFGVQGNQEILYAHPNGRKFNEVVVPNYKELVQTAKKNHLRLSQNKLISWDFALNENNEIVLIEANFPSGQLDLHQLNNGPIFQEFTEEVLNFVYLNKE